MTWPSDPADWVCELCGDDVDVEPFFPDDGSPMLLCTGHRANAAADQRRRTEWHQARQEARRRHANAQGSLSVDAGQGSFLEPTERDERGRIQRPLIDRIKDGEP